MAVNRHQSLKSLDSFAIKAILTKRKTKRNKTKRNLLKPIYIIAYTKLFCKMHN